MSVVIRDSATPARRAEQSGEGEQPDPERALERTARGDRATASRGGLRGVLFLEGKRGLTDGVGGTGRPLPPPPEAHHCGGPGDLYREARGGGIQRPVVADRA